MYRWIGLVQLQSHVLLSCRGFSFSFTFRFSGSLSLLPDLIFIHSSLPVRVAPSLIRPRALFCFEILTSLLNCAEAFISQYFMQ
nr:hypothetical protein CFP56_26484 [Quercus suber]